MAWACAVLSWGEKTLGWRKCGPPTSGPGRGDAAAAEDVTGYGFLWYGSWMFINAARAWTALLCCATSRKYLWQLWN